MTDEIRGERIDGGGVRLESRENPDAWIEADYRDGWTKRKLMGDADYDGMTHPYYYRCAFCREYGDVQMWGANSPYCPLCEQWHAFVLPQLMAWIVDDEPLSNEQEVEEI